MVAIEIINQCNFNCYFCGAGTIPEPLEMISFNDIKKLIYEMEKLNISFLKLTPSRGEIFLHPEIYEILEFLSRSKIKTIEFHTNFSRINFEKLVLINLSKFRIIISHYGFKGIEEFSYQTRTREKYFYKVEENLIKASQLGINIIIDIRTRQYNYDCETQPRTTINERIGVCSNFWIPRILSNGNMTFCTCSALSIKLIEEDIIGNIYKQTFKELYLSIKRYDFYKTFKDNSLPNLCKNCTSFSNSKIQLNLNSLKNFQIIKQNWNKNNGKQN